MKTWSVLLLILALSSVSQTVFAKGLSIEMDQAVLKLLNAESFSKVLTMAKSKGITTIQFVDKAPHASKVSETLDRNYPGGDAFVMHGLSPEQDKNMRSSEYKMLFPIVDYLSEHRMRVTVNLNAQTPDLRVALQNTRPTIIIWSSHGNDEYFYGANGEAIPHGIFKNTSPSVYQFILSACYGRLAMDNYYLKDIPKEQPFYTVGWDKLTNSDEMLNYLMSERWNMYLGRSTYVNEGLTCEDSKGLRLKDSKEVFSAETNAECGQFVINARQNMICLPVGEKVAIQSISRAESLWGDSFDSMNDCLFRLSRASNKKLCIRQGAEIRAVDSVSGQAGESVYRAMRDCEEALVSEIAL